MADAIGLIETRGFAAAVEATNVMLHTGTVRFVACERTGGGYVTVIVRGAPDAVKSAVTAATRAAEPLGRVQSAHVVTDPHPDLERLLGPQRAPAG